MSILSALDQAKAVQKREISRAELVAKHLETIAALNPRLNAFVDMRGRRAIADAKALDTLKPAPRSVLDGAVTGVKDLNMMRGMFTRLGTKQMRFFLSPFDDSVVARMRQAGLQIVGKLAASELGSSPVTEPFTHGPTRNPWISSHNAGGSSGGSGAAVASGMLAMAHGSDGAGSIRIPASFCGIFGFKATHSLIPNPLGKIDSEDLTTNGPLARDVADLAAMIDVLARLEGRSSLLSRLDAPLTRKPKIHVTFQGPLTVTSPAVVDALGRVARIFETLGFDVEERPWMNGNVEEFLPIWQRLAADVPLPSDYGMMPVTRWLREHGRQVTHTHSMRRKRELEQRVDTWWGDADIWLSPSTPHTAPKNGAYSAMEGAQAFTAMAPIGAFTAIFNLSGQPAGSVPMGYDAEGAPMGVQVVGRRGDDLTVLQLMRILESELADVRNARSPEIHG